MRIFDTFYIPYFIAHLFNKFVTNTDASSILTIN